MDGFVMYVHYSIHITYMCDLGSMCILRMHGSHRHKVVLTLVKRGQKTKPVNCHK